MLRKLLPVMDMTILAVKHLKRFMQILSIRKPVWYARRSHAELTRWPLHLFGNLRPGDELLAPAGKPYDTLEEVIGIRPSKGSLAEYGVSYRQVELLRRRNL